MIKNKMSIKNKLNNMNLTIEEFVELQSELLTQDIKELEKTINSIEENFKVNYQKNNKKISQINHDLLVLNEQIDNILYIEAVKKEKIIKNINEKRKVIEQIKNKNKLKKIYTYKIQKLFKNKKLELTKNIKKEYKDYFKDIKINYSIIIALYFIISYLYFLK